MMREPGSADSPIIDLVECLTKERVYQELFLLAEQVE